MENVSDEIVLFGVAKEIVVLRTRTRETSADCRTIRVKLQQQCLCFIVRPINHVDIAPFRRPSDRWVISSVGSSHTLCSADR